MFGINLFVVLIASVSGVGLSTLWYSKLLFGRRRAEFSQTNHAGIGDWARGRYRTLLAIFAVEFVTAYVLAYLIALTGSYSLFALAELIFWVWLGFAVAVSLNHVFQDRQPWSICFISIGYYLISWMMIGSLVVYLPKLL